jgi:hypothetical protein
MEHGWLNNIMKMLNFTCTTSIANMENPKGKPMRKKFDKNGNTLAITYIPRL